MEEYRVLYSARSQRKAGTVVNPHCHNCYELVYYVRDEGIITINGVSDTLHDGSFALIPPGILHSELHAADNDVLFVQFECPDHLDLFFSPDPEKSIYHVAKVMAEELCKRPPDHEKMLFFKMQELVLLLQRWQSGNVLQHSQKDFYYIVRYLAENFHEKINFVELANRFHYSYDYFQHRFKAITGSSPREYLQTCRITKAKELLRTTALSCTEITYRCGFSNSNQFSKLFRKRVGITPLKYRALPRKEPNAYNVIEEGSDLL